MIKYFYKGQSLRMYCKENNLKYDCIVKRIKIKGMSVAQAVETQIIPNLMYTCSNGTPLNKVAKNISEYRACLWRMRNFGVSVDDSFKPISRCKHYYKDKSFKEICGNDYNRYRRALNRYRNGYSKQVALFGTKWDLIYG